MLVLALLVALRLFGLQQLVRVWSSCWCCFCCALAVGPAAAGACLVLMLMLVLALLVARWLFGLQQLVRVWSSIKSMI
jgi:hypothetical protein